MKTSLLILLAAPALAVPALGRGPSATAGTAAAAGEPPACEATAVAVRKTAQLEAHADFWLSVATCINAPGPGLPNCLGKAARARDEALELAQEQFEARLEVCEELGHGPYDPQLDPQEFSPNVTNPYLPLVIGRTLVYEKLTPEGLERVEVTTLNETVEIEGFECRVVKDVVFLKGELIEDTDDWFAQRTNGDVWYFGEIARNYEDGLLDNLEGSWRTGKDGGKPGILMLAAPVVGDLYRQEYLINEAEDLARVVSLGETVTVPAGTFTNCLKTLEGSPLEPDALEWKFYAPGTGLVLEVDLETGERLELIQIL